MKNLLVELFVEELPPKALKKLGEAFAGELPKPQGARAWLRARSDAHGLRHAAPAGRAHHRRGRAGRRQGGVAS